MHFERRCTSPVMLQSVMARACRWDRVPHSAGKVPLRCVLYKARAFKLGKLSGPAQAAGRLPVTGILFMDNPPRAGKAPLAPHSPGKVPASSSPLRQWCQSNTVIMSVLQGCTFTLTCTKAVKLRSRAGHIGLSELGACLKKDCTWKNHY